MAGFVPVSNGPHGLLSYWPYLTSGSLLMSAMIALAGPKLKVSCSTF